MQGHFKVVVGMTGCENRGNIMLFANLNAYYVGLEAGERLQASGSRHGSIWVVKVLICIKM